MVSRIGPTTAPTISTNAVPPLQAVPEHGRSAANGVERHTQADHDLTALQGPGPQDRRPRAKWPAIPTTPRTGRGQWQAGPLRTHGYGTDCSPLVRQVPDERRAFSEARVPPSNAWRSRNDLLASNNRGGHDHSVHHDGCDGRYPGRAGAAHHPQSTQELQPVTDMMIPVHPPSRAGTRATTPRRIGAAPVNPKVTRIRRFEFSNLV